jgi:hypothetical protein
VTVAGEGGQAERAFIGRPVRLLVRRVDGADRVTLVRQPDFTAPEDDIGCCLLVDDLRLAADRLRLVPVVAPGRIADAVHAIDFDGDGTDELLVTRSLPRLGNVSYPTEARVLRWRGDAFGDPTVTKLPVGSGDTPFILGDSDGEPGEEAAIVSVTGRPDLYRLRLDADDMLEAEAAGLVVADARAVPLQDGRGIAVTGSVVGLSVMRWPPHEAPGRPIASHALDDGRIIGVIESADRPGIVVREASQAAGRLFALPELTSPIGGRSLRSAAAIAHARGPVRPYVGVLPGGGPDGSSAVIVEGELVGAGGSVAMATLAGAEPIGLVGAAGGWLAIRHAPTSAAPLDPRGGRLDQPSFPPASRVALVPLELALQPEADGGRYAAPTSATTPLPGGEMAVSEDGFVATVHAPPGSLLYLSGPAPDDPGPARVVEAGGTRQVTVTPRVDGDSTGPIHVSMTIVTPAGHGYVSAWSYRVVRTAPDLDVAAETSFGSTDVIVRGRTAPYASVTVAGGAAAVGPDGTFASTVVLPPWPTEVSVVVSDPFGHEATRVVTAVGVFDYRTLPWGLILLGLVGGAGVVLVRHVPRMRPAARAAGDDAMLEDLEPD